jgi:acetyltransferase-like isoleucine patch superfamily enzyme
MPTGRFFLNASEILIMAQESCCDGIMHRLGTIGEIVETGLDRTGTLKILEIIGLPSIQENILVDMKIYSEYLPKSPFSEEQRCLHFLWDVFERAPLSVATNFSIPFRRILAKKLFRRCGKNFCAESNIRFNFGQYLSVGNDVFLNAGTFIDSKGGVTIGDAVGIGEFVRIFTHTHSESNHAERSYAPVTIDDYAKIYTGAMIFPGVSIGEQAIVAGGAVVTGDVPPNTVVAGIPAKPIRLRKNEGKHREQLYHTWLYKSAFQDE